MVLPSRSTSTTGKITAESVQPVPAAHRWVGGGFVPAVSSGELVAADSWLVVDGRVRDLPAHHRRFTAAVSGFRDMPIGRVREFLAALPGLVPARGRWFPRVECGPGASGLELRLVVRPAPPPAEEVVVAPHRGRDPRRAPRVKGPDLPALVRLRDGAAAVGAGELLLTDENGLVLEGALSSVVWWRDDVLCVPPPELPVLPGVTRARLVRLAWERGITVRPERVRLPDLDGLEVWTLSALHGIRSVAGWADCALLAGPALRRRGWQRLLTGLAEPW